MAANNLTTSADGLKKLEVREALIEGLYNDISGYGTYGVGHLVHPNDKWGSFLLQSAQANKLCESRIKKKWPGTAYETTYLEREVLACKEYDQLKSKTQDDGQETIAQVDKRSREHATRKGQQARQSQNGDDPD